LDNTPPTLSVISPENKTYTVNKVSLTFTLDELALWIGYNLDQQRNVTIVGNTILSELSDGPHTIIIYAEDIVGNIGISETIYFNIKTQQTESLQLWIIVAIVIIAIVGTTFLIYFTKIKKTNEKIQQSNVQYMRAHANAIALIVATVVWFIALYLHIQGYNRYMQNEIEHFMAILNVDKAGARAFVEGYWDGPPIWAWRFGPVLTTSALAIFLAWVWVIISAFKYMLRSHKHNNS
jgi:uncharacterized membrane protein